MTHTKFTIHGSNGQAVTVDGTYFVHDNGVLAVKPVSGAPYIMSPSGWVQVTILEASEAWDISTGASDDRFFGTR